MVEFDCADCGVHVYAFGLIEPVPPGQRCAHCQWLADIPDPVEREQLRASLIKIGDQDRGSRSGIKIGDQDRGSRSGIKIGDQDRGY